MTRSIRDFSDHLQRLTQTFHLDHVRPAVAAAQLAWSDLFGSSGTAEGASRAGAADFVAGLGRLIAVLERHLPDDPDLRYAIDRLAWYQLLATALADRGPRAAADLLETTRLDLLDGLTLGEIVHRLAPPTPVVVGPTGS